MKNIYHRDIIEILTDCGPEGFSVRQIARRIYNLHADLFVTDFNYDEIHQAVGLYLWKQSKRRESPFCRTAFGKYALKRDFAFQLDLFHDFLPRKEATTDEVQKPSEPAPAPGHIQLELF